MDFTAVTYYVSSLVVVCVDIRLCGLWVTRLGNLTAVGNGEHNAKLRKPM